MTDPEVRRLPAMLDAPLARLSGAREELAKAWLLELLDRSSLEAIERIAMERIARELPGMVAEIVESLARLPGRREAENAARARAGAIARLRDRDGSPPGDLARDIADLQAVLLHALRRELQDEDPHTFGEVVARLTAGFAEIQAAAVEEVTGARERELETLANTDALTGLYNVRWMLSELERMLEHHRRYGHTFSLLLLDIDGLKRVNDSLGHPAGDRALVGVAEAIRSGIRAVDSAVRIGGDEFCVIAPQQSASRASTIANRIAAAVEAAGFPDGAPVGISIGVVSCPRHGADADTLLALADEAMYRAKAAGSPFAVADAPETRAGAGT